MYSHYTKKPLFTRLTTMLATSKNVYFQVMTTTGSWAITKVLGHQCHWLVGGYDLEMRHFLEVACIVVTWWIVAFLHSVSWLFYLPWSSVEHILDLSRLPGAKAACIKGSFEPLKIHFLFYQVPITDGWTKAMQFGNLPDASTRVAVRIKPQTFWSWVWRLFHICY